MEESTPQVKLSQTPTNVIAQFDDTHLIGFAGLVPTMRLAESADLYQLAKDLIHVPGDKGSNPDMKIASLIAGMVAGADCIDEMDLIRHGGMDKLFNNWRAPSTLGCFLRAFSFGHARQVDALAARLLAGLDQRCPLFGPVNMTGPVMVDIDDTVIPVFSAAKQGAAIGYTRVRGLDLLIATASTKWSPPVVIGQRLRKGSAHSARGATKLIEDSLGVIRRSSVADRQVWLRADSGFYSNQIADTVCSQNGWFSLTVRMNPQVRNAIATIPEHAWTPIRYPNAIYDDDTGMWISAAEVAETTYEAFTTTKHPLPVRLVVRRIPDFQAAVKIAQGQDPLFANWRFHGFITNVPQDLYDTVGADKTHRQHAVIEQVNAALKDAALAHLPCKKFSANMVWATCAIMAFNLTRALASLTGDQTITQATPDVIRRCLIQIPARIATTGRRTILHLPDNWKWADQWLTAFTITIQAAT